MTMIKETIQPKISHKHSYNVLIENSTHNQVKASVLEWEDCFVEAATKEEAINKLRQLLTNRLQNKEIISLEIELPPKQHPWMKFAGMHQNNPLFPEVLEEIENNRQSLDQEVE